MTKQLIYHVCGKEKKSYNVFMEGGHLSMVMYCTARDDGEVCESCWKYYCLTHELKPHTDLEFKNAKIAKRFSNIVHKWWTKDKELDINNNINNIRVLDTEENLIKWFLDEGDNNVISMYFYNLFIEWWKSENKTFKDHPGTEHMSKWCRDYLNK